MTLSDIDKQRIDVAIQELLSTARTETLGMSDDYYNGIMDGLIAAKSAIIRALDI